MLAQYMGVAQFPLPYFLLESFHISLYLQPYSFMVWLTMQDLLHSAGDDRNFPLHFEGTNGLLVESIDESFATLLGQGAKDALYKYLMKKRALDVKEIPERLDDFDGCLQEAFGRAAEVIERNILLRFYHKLGLEFSGKTGYAFSDYVHETRKDLHDL